MGGSERQRELKRRRHRREKVAKIKGKLEKASPSEKAKYAEQLRKLTSGATVLIKDLGLEER